MADVDIGSLTLQVSANAKSATTSINNLKTSLDGLKNTVSGMTGLTDVAAQMRFLVQGMNSMSGAADSFKAFKSVASSIKSTLKSLRELDDIDLDHATEQISELCSTLGMLGEVNKAQGFASTINALKKLPSVAQDLNNMDIYEFAGNIIEISGALEPLASQIDRISSGFGQLPQRLNSLNAASGRAATGVSRFGTIMSRVFSYVVMRRVAGVISGWIKKSTEYVEDLNLFTVAMGRYADSAQEYAEKVSEVMGIDVAQWMRAQGVFATLATGFGVSADRAAIMSKNLTQLAYDLSSFYNLDVDKAMQKLESGFAGEIEPVRRLGYDLSKTTLQATAADLGITKLFADMTQAEKSQLRYYALMTQVTQVQGDMARTLTAPANQLRILSAQMEMAKRALGNVFIPALNAVLPLLIAFAKFVRLVADEIARFFGYTLPEIDYSGISVGIGDVEDSVEDLSGSLGHASGRAKELKGLLASFDQLNIIQSETGGGHGGGSGGIGGLDSDGWRDFELPQYDFLKNVLTSRADEIFAKMRRGLEKWKPVLRWIRDHLSQIFDIVKAIGLVLLGWKVSNSVANLFGKTLTPAKGLGLGLMLGGFSLEFSGMRNIGAGKAQIWDYLKAAIGAALGIGGSLLAFGTGPLGWTIGIGAALVIAFTGFALGDKERVQEEVASEFRSVFEGAIDPDEYADIVKERFNSISDRLQNGLEIKANVDADLTELSDVLGTIDDYRVKLSGVGSLTSEEIEGMNEAFRSLYEVGGRYISDSYDLLENGLLNALRILPEETHAAISGYLTELGVLEAQEKDALQQYTAAYEDAMLRATQATPGSIAQQAALEDAAHWQTAIGLYTGAVIDAGSALAGAMARANASIDDVNFDSMDSVSNYLDKVKTAYEESVTYVNDYWGGLIEVTNQKLAAAMFAGDQATVDKLTRDIDVLKLAQKAQLEELANALDQETIPIANRMAGAMENMYNEAAIEVQFSPWYAAMWHGGYEEWTQEEVQKRATEWYRNYLSPLADEMDALGTPRAQEVANAIRDGWTNGLGWKFDPRIGGDGNVTKEEWLNYVNTVLEATEGLVPQATSVGTDLGNAFGRGLTSAVRHQTDELGTRLSVWWQNIHGSSAPHIHGSTFDFGSLDIPMFASGGLPTRGSLFLAGEGGGAELVGSMGSQTAVANGDQIVAGIAYGVSQANAEEARLLREILGYVRKVAQNGGNVVFSPSPEAGRAISYAMDMYATQRGY